MFHTMSAPLKVIAVFILHDETQERNWERYHETRPFFLWAERAAGAVTGTPEPAAVMEIPQHQDTGPRMLSSHQLQA